MVGDRIVIGFFMPFLQKTFSDWTDIVQSEIIKLKLYASIYNIFKLHILSKYRTLQLKKINAMLLQKHLTELHERIREHEIDNELVTVWTGHSLGNITSSVYTHFSMEFQKEQAVKLKYII